MDKTSMIEEIVEALKEADDATVEEIHWTLVQDGQI